MSSDDCARLVNLLIATWPAGPKAYVWTQALSRFDAGPAFQAYALLRDHEERITVATFGAQYRRVVERERARNQPTQETLTEPALSPSEYVARLTARAATGDQSAAAELATWQRMTGLARVAEAS